MIMSNIVVRDTIQKAMRAGVDEVLDKFSSLDEIIAAVRRLGSS